MTSSIFSCHLLDNTCSEALLATKREEPEGLVLRPEPYSLLGLLPGGSVLAVAARKLSLHAAQLAAAPEPPNATLRLLPLPPDRTRLEAQRAPQYPCTARVQPPPA